ncbi:MAG TPA: ferritin-like domain-containing protein [Bryobacteraceae bacterium]|nr:ferritin-like domain-containing protein [Bryobacteraceae bacterium]
MAKVETLHDLFVEELKDIYHAEKQLLKALPKMAKASESQELKEAFQQHLEETRNQVTRIEQVFEEVGAKAKAKPCAGMQGLIAEGQEVMSENTQDALYDLGLIGAGRRVEHYEIAAYSGVIAMAKQLGHTGALELLQENLSEEEATDKKLMQLSKGMIKRAPMQEEYDEEEGVAEDAEQEEEDVTV